jgi:serine/threonine protein kinase/Tfp pilus assembly protein PilF
MEMSCEWDSVADNAAELFRDLHRADAETASRFAEATTSLPETGSQFLGFHLLEELGRGAFGRVYLAQQEALANRYVALKISARRHQESQTLAQLQHTNIVPIYSVHSAGPFEAVCMPYFGSMTLADIFQDLRNRGTVPLSGNYLVSTLHGRKESTFECPVSFVSRPTSDHSSNGTREVSKNVSSGILADLERRESPAILERLGKLDYVHAILWLAARLADGLAHAHERGIIHRDLKPANILLTNDGQPMLLDFNLSEDLKAAAAASAARVGGTLPYMAPEHLEALSGEPRRVDARSDIYSLGLILFELLTGQKGFANRSGSVHRSLPAMIEERKKTVPALRPWNKFVSPAVESIVQHCLQPDPDKRYQSAQDLREDLERHLADLPLKHVPEPSIKERLQKWTRRHPRLASSTSIAVVAAFLLVALSLGFVSRQERLAKLEAEERFQAFVDDAKSAKLLLNKLEPGQKDLEEGIRFCSQAVDRYRIGDDSSWTNEKAVRQLSASEQTRLREDAGEILLTWARARLLQAQHEKDPVKRQEKAGDGLRLNKLAETNWGDRQSSKVLWLQRAELSQLLGREQEARQLADQAEKLQPQNVRDYYYLAIRHSDRREFDKAIPLLSQATQLDPENFWAWFYLGYCHGELQESQAEYCYTTCIALSSNSRHSFYPYLNRGLEYLKQQKFEAACADFDRAIQIRPESPDAYIDRAIVRKEMARALLASRDPAQKKENAASASSEKIRTLHNQAEQDLATALKLNPEMSRAYLIRAGLHEQIGDVQKSKSDRALALRFEPGDAPTWIDRGLTRLADDPKGALADFDKALELSPRSHVAMQNKAHVLAERLGRPQEALAVLNKLIELYPGFVYARIGRGVLLARMGKREEAHADARAALEMDNKPSTYYQAANVYALTSRLNPDDKLLAFPLLSIALRGGFGLNVLEQDSDMDPIRKHPEFIRLQKAAQALQANAPSKSR